MGNQNFSHLDKSLTQGLGDDLGLASSGAGRAGFERILKFIAYLVPQVGELVDHSDEGKPELVSELAKRLDTYISPEIHPGI